MKSRQRYLIEQACVQGYEVDIKTGTITSKTGRKLKGSANKDGYLMVTISLSDSPPKGEMVYVHRLVAYAKFGDKLFDPSLEVRHKDGNPGNSRGKNIILGTRSENLMDIPEGRRGKGVQGVPSEKRLLTEKQAEQIRRAYAQNTMHGRVKPGICTHFADKFGVSLTVVSAIGKGKSYNV